MSTSTGGTRDPKLLRLRLETTEGAGTALLEFSVGGEWRSVSVALADLGLGPRSSRYDSFDPARVSQLPRATQDELRALVGPSLSPHDMLWLQFGQPSGGLATLQWERWLVPLFGVTVLRWPYLPVAPLRVRRPARVAVCASVPEAKERFAPAELLRGLLDQTREVGRQVQFFVFVDAGEEPSVRAALDVHGDGMRVEIVPAASAAAFGDAPRIQGLEDVAEAVENPWLRWMLASLPPRVDVVHFLCHGYFADGRGALAFAESPLRNRDPRWARFVGGLQLTTFLDHCGASALALSSPMNNFSVSGLYALADEVARQRPGPVLLHELENDSERDDLGRALAFLFAQSTGPLPTSASLAIYCPPEYLRSGPRLGGEGWRGWEGASSTRGPDELLSLPVRVGLGSDFGDALAEGEEEEERWVVASQRVLERYATDLARTGQSSSEVGQATQRGKSEALKFVSDLLKDHRSGTGGGHV